MVVGFEARGSSISTRSLLLLTGSPEKKSAGRFAVAEADVLVRFEDEPELSENGLFPDARGGGDAAGFFLLLASRWRRSACRSLRTSAMVATVGMGYYLSLFAE